MVVQRGLQGGSALKHCANDALPRTRAPGQVWEAMSGRVNHEQESHTVDLRWLEGICRFLPTIFQSWCLRFMPDSLACSKGIVTSCHILSQWAAPLPVAHPFPDVHL